MDTTKHPLQSKTLWLNLIMAAIAFIPAVQAFTSSHPMVLPEALTVANFVLRFVTKDKLSLQD